VGVVAGHLVDVGVACEDLLEGVDDGHHILGAVDPAEPRPGPLSWHLDGRHQGVTLWIGIGIWIGLDAKTHAEAVVLCQQPPAPVFVAEEGHRDSGRWEPLLQEVAQGFSNHPRMNEFILLSFEDRKPFCLNQQSGLGDHGLIS
jgi:hypothetical protein